MNFETGRIGRVDLQLAAPASKSYSHRAFVMAALAGGTSIIRHPLIADDTRLTLRALASLGVGIEESTDEIRITGCDGKFSCAEETTLDLGNSGTSLRLLTTLALLAPCPVMLTGSARMQERPVGPLADTLRSLGGKIRFLKKDGFPPFTISGDLVGGKAKIDGSLSSQFISSILIAAPYSDHGIDLVVATPPASRSYLDITVDMMKRFGGVIERDGYARFRVSNTDRYRGSTYTVEGDYSSASYLFAIAALCGGKVTVTNLFPDSVQGDRAFPEALRKMGCTVEFGRDSVTVMQDGPLNGITVDMSSAPDTVQTLCVVAAMAKTPTTITGIGHLKWKESDRIASTAENLRQLGGNIVTDENSITIRPAPLHGGTIDPADDHRTAMSFAILGLAIGGVTITNAECVSKSFPGFWKIIERVTK